MTGILKSCQHTVYKSDIINILTWYSLDEPRHGLFNGLSDGQDTMVLQNQSFLVAQILGNVRPFFVRNDHAPKIRVERMIFIEYADILVRNV